MTTTITLENIGKRFGRDWIFRKVNYQFTTSKTYAILGPNGSGKSTLLQLIACSQSPSEGTIQFSNGNGKIDPENVFLEISLCAPYLQLIEELTLTEQLHFHFRFKKAIDGLQEKEMLDLLGLQAHVHKQIRYFSSGMKQRVKLCLSLLSDVSTILLDEPATNLDKNGLEWYNHLLEKFLKGRLLIVSSNREDEYQMCGEKIFLPDYK